MKGTPTFKTMSDRDSRALLRRSRVGRLAFTFRDRVDIEPIGYVLDGSWLYGRTSYGEKLDVTGTTWWPVAFEVDEVEELFRWRSVVVHGGFYTLENKGVEMHREKWREGVALLRSLVPETFTGADPAPQRTVVFCLAVQEITGREAVPVAAGGP